MSRVALERVDLAERTEKRGIRPTPIQ